jgi:multiple sugar transport system substrate-binding protein
VIANFEKAYPSINIAPPPAYGAGTPFYSKLTTSLEGGTGPCLTQIEYDHVPFYRDANDLLNISKYMAPYQKDFPAWVWGQVSYSGGVYAVPEDIGPMGLMYQPGVLKKYGLAVPTTWSQFASEAVTLHKDNPKIYFTDFLDDADWVESLFWQAGAFPYLESSNGDWTVNLDGPIEQKVMTFWGNLVKDDGAAFVSDGSPDFGHDVAADNFASMVGAAWAPTYDVDAYLPANSTQEWAVAQMPQWTAGSHASSNWGGSANAVTKDCPSADVADAVTFATFIDTSKSGLAVDESPATTTGGGRGLFPATLARTSVPEFLAPVPHFTGRINQDFSTYAGQVPTKFEWSPWDTVFVNDMTTQLAAAQGGKQSWGQALAAVQSEVVSYAKSAGYSVSG